MHFFTFLNFFIPFLSVAGFIYGLGNFRKTKNINPPLAKLNLILIMMTPIAFYYSPYILEKLANNFAKLTSSTLKDVSILKDKEKQMERVKLPIIYHPRYNIEAFGLENMHSFDAHKYGKIYNFLVEKGIIKSLKDIYKPDVPSRSLLLTVHSKDYLKSLLDKRKLASMVEVPMLERIPSIVLRWLLLECMLQATQGTVDGAIMALKRGWAINLSGGYHHASANKGGGFCIYADITIAIKNLFSNYSEVKKVMIIDLDAHQGNGHERDFTGDSSVYIIDAYNPQVYPGDTVAMKGISLGIKIYSKDTDEEYLTKLKNQIPNAIDQFKPDFILFNAGTDILQSDHIGRLNISPEGIIKRDDFIFGEALSRKIPILMVLSGGYQKSNAKIIADSIENLIYKYKLIQFFYGKNILKELQYQFGINTSFIRCMQITIQQQAVKHFFNDFKLGILNGFYTYIYYHKNNDPNSSDFINPHYVIQYLKNLAIKIKKSTGNIDHMNIFIVYYL